VYTHVFYNRNFTLSYFFIVLKTDTAISERLPTNIVVHCIWNVLFVVKLKLMRTLLFPEDKWSSRRCHDYPCPAPENKTSLTLKQCTIYIRHHFWFGFQIIPPCHCLHQQADLFAVMWSVSCDTSCRKTAGHFNDDNKSSHRW